jgi:predicted patatin/cPLA2 family phospholipase
LTKIIDKIDFDDPVWRKLFSLDLSKNPTIQEKVENKKKEIEKIQEEIKTVLKDILPNDIIQY